MTRVLLINPPSPEQLGAPLLGLQYVAASLLARGCEVRVIDAAARGFRGDAAEILKSALAFDPHVVGFGLFTRWVWHAYRLAGEFRGRFPLLVAGGPHATVCPDEVLDHGFDVAVTGEAEITIARIIDSIENGTALGGIAGIRFRDGSGARHDGPPARRIDDLDALSLPQEAQSLFKPEWYVPGGGVAIPGGILTSRGCPARCTFCANYVTGRSFRYRTGRSVLNELNRYHARFGAAFFPFWDDALTADPQRLLQLCGLLEREIEFPLGWSAITRASMITPELLRHMRRAGCVAVNFGVESGDDEILRSIKKGITVDQVERALEWAKTESLQTCCNFMLGFPQETPRALGRTLRFMERIAPLVDSFSTLGVVVPFPGTALYEAYRDRFRFTDWWLRPEYAKYEPPPPHEDADRFFRYYIDDANLELDFFSYEPAMKDLIRACLRFKAEHNLRRMGFIGNQVA